MPLPGSASDDPTLVPDPSDPATIRVVTAHQDAARPEAGPRVESLIATVIVDERTAARADARAATIVVRPPAADDEPLLPPSSAGAPNTELAGGDAARYVVVGLAGRGGMGTVHIAQDVDLLRRVALKELTEEAALDRSARARFVREVQVTAQLDHPHIVPVDGLEVAPGGRPAYAMKLVEGRTFAELIEETRAALSTGALDESHSLTARLEHFVKVCDAVAYAHARGVVHRDLKPANLMLGSHNEVDVMDWGICRVVQAPGGPTALSAPALDRPRARRRPRPPSVRLSGHPSTCRRSRHEGVTRGSTRAAINARSA